MATVDELVVKLTLDNAEFRDSIDRMQEQLRALREHATRQTGAVETSAHKAADGFTKLRNEVLGLLAAFVSTRAIIEFTKHITEMDNALGRAATSSGLTITQLGAWQGAARAMGSSANTFAKAINLVQDAMGAYQAGEQSPFLAMMTRIKLDVAYAKDGLVDYEETVKRIADWASKQTDVAGRNFALRSMGFSPDDIANLVAGRQQMEAMFKIAEEFAAKPKDREAAMQRTLEMYKFSAAIEQVGRNILTFLTPQINQALQAMSAWIAKNKEWIQQDVVTAAKNIFGVIRDIAVAANKAAEAMGGWSTVANILIGIKLASWLLGVAEGIVGLGAALLGLERAGAGIALIKWLVGTFGAAALGGYLGFTVGKGGSETPEHERVEEERILREGSEVEKRMILDRRARREAARASGGATPGAPLPTLSPGNQAPINQLAREVGSTPDQILAFREALGRSENKATNTMGGAGGAYAGQWQMGRPEIDETARSLGEPSPSPQQFLNDLDMQQRYWAQYTLNHHRKLMEDPVYAALPPTERIGILGASHLGGTEGGRALMRTGEVRSDGHKTTADYRDLARGAAQAQGNSRIEDERKRAIERLIEIGKTPAAAPVIAPLPRAPPPDPSLRSALHPSAFNPGAGTSTTTNDNSRTATTHINGPITVTTQANDADGIARGLRSAIARNGLVGQADYGLA